MRHLTSRLATAIALTLSLLLIAPAAILAHAELDVPTPTDGTTFEGTPATIEGTFTQDLDAEGSSLQLRGAEDTLIAEGGVVEGDPRRMAIGRASTGARRVRGPLDQPLSGGPGAGP